MIRAVMTMAAVAVAAYDDDDNNVIMMMMDDYGDNEDNGHFGDNYDEPDLQ